MSVTTPVASLLKPFSSLQGSAVKAVAAVLGAAVADAAARPLHWVYDNEKMEKLFEENRNLEFWPESESPFYSLPLGSRSCYNHVLMVGLQSFVESGTGAPDLAVYRRILTQTFGEETEWQEALARRREAYSPVKRRNWKQEPVEGPWLHVGVINFLEKGLGDPDNKDMDGFLLSLPHLVFNVEEQGVVEECLAISSLLTGNKIFPKMQAEVLKTVLLSGTLDKEEILNKLDSKALELTQEVFHNLSKEHKPIVQTWGNACSLPGSYQGSLHGFLKYINHAKDSDIDPLHDRFISAVRATIRAGGCNCSRANYLGALTGAAGGLKALPSDWMTQVTGIRDIVTMLHLAAKKIRSSL